MKRIIFIALLLLPVLFACDKATDQTEGAIAVVLSYDKIDLMAGETATLTAQVLPESLGMGVVWSVLDPEYAEVMDGVVTAKAEGVTYVIATSADNKQKASCMVSVNPEVRYSVTVQDETGNPINGVWGYPGMSTILYASTTDGETHEFTWSVYDASAASISDDGKVTLLAAASTDDAYVYDAQSFIKVVTEDGLGTKIPLRSSLLAGVQINGAFQPAGLPITVEESQQYTLSLLCEGQMEPVAIPANGVNTELSDNTHFTLTNEGGVLKLITGATSNVSTTLSVCPIGSIEKTPVAQFKIDKTFPIKAFWTGSSSSTLVFTWTLGGEADVDVVKPYTISLYKDEDCTDLEASFEIPAEDPCWNSRQPKFVFSGLAQNTNYWFKVVQTGSEEEVYSDIIPATTEAFNIVMVSSTPAAEGDIILAEDFGQMCWGADEMNQAAGYDVSDVGYNTDTKKSFTSRDVASFVKTTGWYAQRSITAQSVAKKESGFRLANWAQGQYARIYIGPGYLFISTTSYGTHLITPKLDNIPEGKTATVKVTLHAAGMKEGNEAVLAVQHGISFYEMSSNNQTNKNKLKLEDNAKTITFNGGITTLSEFEVTLENVVSGDRIAFGPTTETNTTGNTNMMLLSDMTIQIVELN